jgi:hypothetical protein
MGEWKIQVSVRVSQALRVEFEKYAAAEKRTLGNFGAVLLEWAFEQLKAAGSTEKLLRRKAPIPRNPDGNYKRSPETQKLLGK